MNKKHIELALEQLELVSVNPPTDTTGTGGDNARYGYIDVDGRAQPKGVNYFIGYERPSPKLAFNCHPCHAYMSGYNKASVVWTTYQVHKSIQGKVGDAYKKFLLTGPWKAFLDACRCIVNDHGFIFPDLDKCPSNLLLNCMVAIRMAKEWPTFIQSWYDLVYEDIEPSVAYWFVTVFGQLEKGNFNSPAKDKPNVLQILNKYDWPLDVVTSNIESLKNFRAGLYFHLNQPFSVSPSYKPVNRIWGHNEYSFNDGFCRYIYEKYNNKLGKKVSSTKPKQFLIRQSETDAIQSTGVQEWQVSWDELITVIKNEQYELNTQRKVA